MDSVHMYVLNEKLMLLVSVLERLSLAIEENSNLTKSLIVSLEKIDMNKKEACCKTENVND